MPPPSVEPQNLAKSCNEALILACLERGPRHGYQIALDIEQRAGPTFRFNHGTLYPILHKLEQEGLIKGSWSRGEPPRRRKSYELTAKGRRYAQEQREAWRLFIQQFLSAVEVDES
ncbi:MAG: helix-turn-helix transcriptional regulator [Gemmatimonadales bacterium]